MGAAHLLDVGSGPGSAFWAACDQWPSIEHATMIEACDPIRRVGEGLAKHLAKRAAWISADIQRAACRRSKAPTS